MKKITIFPKDVLPLVKPKAIELIERVRENKPYSRIDEIPSGRATDEIKEGCLVLEGGGFRGLYTQGFLDALMLKGINFSCVIGTSAGALSGMNYVSGQIGRSARINLTYRHDSRYIGAKALIREHSLVNVGFLTDERGVIEPLDEDRFYRSPQRFIAVAANCNTGEATYFEKGKCSDVILAARASATMPYISQMVMIDGEPYLDGGSSCKIPYQWAIDQGYEKIVVIRTRDIRYRKPARVLIQAERFYRNNPEFAKKLAHSNLDYNAQCDEIEKLAEEGRLCRYAPSKPVKVGRIENDLEKLGDLYWLGYNDCMEHVEEIRNI